MKWFATSLIIAAAASALADRPERNAFLNYSVHSVNELIVEVNKDPAVADRFERHFAMTQDQVVEYFRGLHLTRLEGSAVYNVYSIPPDGHVKMHLEKLRNGVPIFADSNGIPILLVKCGNPINLGPQKGSILIGGPSSPEVPANPSPQPSILTPDTDIAMAPPPTPGDIYVPPVVDQPPVIVGTTMVATSHSANYAWLGFIAAGGVIWGLTTIHDHHPHHPTPPPVPEPSTYALLGLGLGGVLLRRKRSNKA